MSTCKKHTLPPALPSLSTRHLGFPRHFLMPLIRLSFYPRPALVAKDPLKRAHRLDDNMLWKWVVQIVKKLKKWTCGAASLKVKDFVHLLMAIQHQDLDLDETSISIFQWCWNAFLFIKQETVKIKKKSYSIRLN